MTQCPQDNCCRCVVWPLQNIHLHLVPRLRILTQRYLQLITIVIIVIICLLNAILWTEDCQITGWLCTTANTFARIIFATHLRREKLFTADLPVDIGNTQTAIHPTKSNSWQYNGNDAEAKIRARKVHGRELKRGTQNQILHSGKKGFGAGGGGRIDLGARHDVNGARISTWETHSSTAVTERTFRCSNLNWLFIKLFRKQANSALETKAAAGKIMLFRIPKHTQLTFVYDYENQTSKTLADGDLGHRSIILIATVDDLSQCQQSQDIYRDVGPTVHTTALLLHYSKLRQWTAVTQERHNTAVKRMILAYDWKINK